MRIRFNNLYLGNLYEKGKIGGKPRFSNAVIKGFKEVIRTMESMTSSNDLYQFKGLHFEKLKGDLLGYHSVRIDRKYRLILSIEEDRILVEEVVIIEDLTNHYD